MTETTALADTVRRLLLVPEHHRVYDCSELNCRRVWGLDDAAVERAIQVGLPHTRGPDGALFDRRDIMTIASVLGRNRLQRRMMSRWVALAQRARDKRLVADVEIVGQVAGAGPVDVLSPDGTSQRMVDRPEREAWSWERAPLAPFDTPHAVQDLLKSVQDVELFHIPWEIREEQWVFEDARIADCRSATFHITRLARAAAIEARASWGLIVCAPYSTPHAWVEFAIEGRWIPIDIHMAAALTRWGMAPKEDIMTIARTLPGLYWRWSEQPTSFVHADGVDFSLSFPTTVTLHGEQREKSS